MSDDHRGYDPDNYDDTDDDSDLFRDCPYCDAENIYLVSHLSDCEQSP